MKLMRDEEYAKIAQVLRESKPETIFEVGAASGEGTVNLAKACPDANIYSFDKCEEAIERDLRGLPCKRVEFWEALREWEASGKEKGFRGKVETIGCDPRDWLCRREIKCDAVVMDGEHRLSDRPRHSDWHSGLGDYGIFKDIAPWM